MFECFVNVVFNKTFYSALGDCVLLVWCSQLCNFSICLLESQLQRVLLFTYSHTYLLQLTHLGLLLVEGGLEKSKDRGIFTMLLP